MKFKYLFFLLCGFWAYPLQAAPDFQQIQTQAMQGDPDSQYQLARYYSQQDAESQAELWYQNAAEQGHTAAQTEYAWLRYAAQDYDTAAHYYTIAAHNQSAKAMFNLGLLYERGDGVSQNPQTALNWYRQAAQLNYPPAQTRLGWLYEYGQYVAQNRVQAAFWYEKAAKLGYAEAQFNLAALLDEQARYRQAAYLYQKASQQNHAKALFNLAVLYQDGKGVSEQPETVRALIQRAANLGLDEARDYLSNQ